MKDLKYFIEREEVYLKEHPEEELVFNEQFREFEFKSFPNDFLRGGWFTKYAKNLPSSPSYEYLHKYGLSDVEIVILYCFLGNLSQYFRDDCFIRYGAIPEESVAMQEILHNILMKAPKNKSEVLYRFLKSGDRTNFNVGETYTPDHSLTTTNESWDQDKDVYIIHPLPECDTNARELFRLINHGNENQVNFIKGTSFQITQIKIGDNGFKCIFMNEIGPIISQKS